MARGSKTTCTADKEVILELFATRTMGQITSMRDYKSLIHAEHNILSVKVDKKYTAIAQWVGDNLLINHTHYPSNTVLITKEQSGDMIRLPLEAIGQTTQMVFDLVAATPVDIAPLPVFGIPVGAESLKEDIAND